MHSLALLLAAYWPWLVLPSLVVVASVLNDRLPYASMRHGALIHRALGLLLDWFAARTRQDSPGAWALPFVQLSKPPAAPVREPGLRPTPVVLPPLPLLLMALALAACGPRSWDQSARIAINGAAHATAAADEVVAGAIARDARDTALTADQLEARYRPAITAMTAVRVALVAAQGAVDAAVATQDAAAKCRAGALVARARALAEELAAALRAAGVTVPDEVPRAIRLAGELAAALATRCTEVPDAG